MKLLPTIGKIEIKAKGIYLTAKSSARDIAQALKHTPQIKQFLIRVAVEK